MRGLRPALLAAAAALYAVAAWAVAPGFFDGTVPSEPYRWVSPPPQLARGNQPPLPGHASITLGKDGRTTDPGTAFSGESQPQAAFSYLAASFPKPGTIDIKPESTFPATTGLACVTNVYLFSASQPLEKEALVTLRFSDAVPAPSAVYRAPAGGGPWTNIGSNGASSPFYISARTTELGYFAGCYPSDAAKTAAGPKVGGGQTLPILVALAILLVVLGGIPLALLRRRGAAGDEEGDEPVGRDEGGAR